MCPECRIPMLAFELDGVEIDHCSRCSGTWLDAGELEAIAERAGAAGGPLSDALDAARDQGASRRRCPRCRKRLRGIRVGADPAVELDRCPRGDGLWFDAGELETVARGHAGDDDDEGAVARWFGRMFADRLTSTTENV